MDGTNDNNVFVSPFLTFDPSVLSMNKDQFIFPEGQKYRGRFERSFFEIGAMVIGGTFFQLNVITISCLGACFGGARGLFNGLKDPEIQKLPSATVKRTQLLNHTIKSGSVLSQTFGSIGLIYALADYVIHKARQNADDELNTFSAATMTGFLYTCPGLMKAGGWKRCLIGSAIGLGVGSAAVAFTSGSKIKQMLGS